MCLKVRKIFLIILLLSLPNVSYGSWNPSLQDIRGFFEDLAQSPMQKSSLPPQQHGLYVMERENGTEYVDNYLATNYPSAYPKVTQRYYIKKISNLANAGSFSEVYSFFNEQIVSPKEYLDTREILKKVIKGSSENLTKLKLALYDTNFNCKKGHKNRGDKKTIYAVNRMVKKLGDNSSLDDIEMGICGEQDSESQAVQEQDSESQAVQECYAN